MIFSGRHRSQKTEPRFPANKSRFLLALTVSLVLAASVPLDSAEAQNPPPSACPEMTDSIRRIYRAYFKREPNAYEAYSWTNRYMSGDASLPVIAGTLAHSSEFNDQWGSRTSSEFVELLYLNTGRTSPAPEVL
ncbi:MAG: hypothetical protein OES24_22840, partial [Acidimicrobiia bacterium]|nr:hypothetical protein [Acidimicrobiia bacterium]